VTSAGLFVTGTDTGVGKTAVAAAIVAILAARGRRVGALKPVSTGCERAADGSLVSDDGRRLAAAIGLAVPPGRVAPIAFEAPLSPPVAAREVGPPLNWPAVLDATTIAVDWWSSRADFLIVEGVGGLLCPLAEGATVADLAVALDYPMLVVARRGLGTLNHVLLTLEAASRRGLRVAGVVLNDATEPTADESEAARTNPFELARRLGPVPILAELRFRFDEGSLSRHLDAIDWEGLSARPRPAPR